MGPSCCQRLQALAALAPFHQPYLALRWQLREDASTCCRERQKAEEEREARRTARFGESAHARQRAGDPTFGGRPAAGRSDFLGYYQLLGLDKVDDREEVCFAGPAACSWLPDLSCL